MMNPTREHTSTSIYLVKTAEHPVSTTPVEPDDATVKINNSRMMSVVAIKNKLRIFRKRSRYTHHRRRAAGVASEAAGATAGVRSLHTSVRGALLVCQFLGMFPVTGLMGKDSEKLGFSWWSIHFIYFVVSLLGQFMMSSMCMYRMLGQGFNLGNCSNMLFYGSALVSTMQFFRLAQSYPLFVRQVTEIERNLPVPGRRVVKNCNWITFFILLFASAEHLLSIMFGLRVAFTCSPQEPLLKAYFDYAVPWVFEYVQYSDWKGILIELFNVQSTFVWNFTDVFIMVISVHLTAHFQHLNSTVFRNKDKEDMSWREPRMQYSQLARLVKLVDFRVSGLILISFSSNLVFICLQLFNSLSKDYSGHFTSCANQGLNKTLRGAEHSVYFTYSFSFLLLRALLVSLLAARVHSAARAPAVALYEVPAPAFCIEVQRFLDQVNFTTVALSGLEFFFVTRGMILTVVGTIVTYELVLLQFGSASPGTLPIHDQISK